MKLSLVMLLAVLPVAWASGAGVAPGVQARRDRFGHPLPPEALVRLGALRLRHLDGHGLSLTFSPDGKTLASASHDGIIRLWEVASGRELRQFQGARGDDTYGWLYPLAFSPDGKTLASGGERIDLWGVATGAKLGGFDIKGVSGVTYSLAFSPDGGTLVSGSAQRTIHLWPVAPGKKHRTLESPSSPLMVLYTPEGKLLALSEHALRDVATKEHLHGLKGWNVLEQGNPFSPDFKVVASVSSRSRKGLFNTIHLREVATGKELCRLRGHRGTVTAVAFSPDGKTVATGGGDQTIQLWDRATGKERLPAGGGPVVAVALSPDGRTVVSADRWAISVWDAATGARVRTLGGPEGPLRSLALSPDGRTLASAGYGPVVLWDPGTGRELGRLEQTWCEGVAFSADGRSLAVGSPNGSGLRVWDVASGKEVRRFEAPPGEAWRSQVFAVAFTPDGKTLAAGGYGMNLWDVDTGHLRRHPLGHTTVVKCILCTPDGKTVISAAGEGSSGEDVVRLWDPASLRDRLQIRGQGGGFSALALSPDGKTLAGVSSRDPRAVRLWEVATGRERGRLAGHRGPVTALAFAADGRALASGSADTTVLLWDLGGHALLGQPRRERLSLGDLERLGDDLAGPGAARAYRALWRLARAPQQTVPYLGAKIAPVPVLAPGRIARLVADLDADRFPVRERASAELARLGPLAEADLRRALAGRPSLEVRRRVRGLLEGLGRGPTEEELLAVRAVEVLERIRTPAARDVLKGWARGAPGARLTEEARGALGRRWEGP